MYVSHIEQRYKRMMNTSQIALAWLSLVGLVGILQGFYAEVGGGWVLVREWKADREV
jgi:hypothetical protein